MHVIDLRNVQRLALISALVLSNACGGTPPREGGSAMPATGGPATSTAPAPPAAPSPYIYPAPVKGHFHETNVGAFDLTDGLAYAAKAGTVVYAASKSIASPVLTGATCPMTAARALALIRNAGFLEITLDPSGRSRYLAAGTPYGGRSREEDVGSHPWKIAGGKLKDGRVAGSVAYGKHGSFEFDLPVATPGVTEVAEGDRLDGHPADTTRRTPSRDEASAAYGNIRRAALAKDLAGLLAAQGFEPKQIEAIRGLPGIEADLAAHADRFLDPGAAEEFTLEAGLARVGARGKNGKEKAFFNFYEFAPCGNALVMVGIGENPQ